MKKTHLQCIKPPVTWPAHFHQQEWEATPTLFLWGKVPSSSSCGPPLLHTHPLLPFLGLSPLISMLTLSLGLVGALVTGTEYLWKPAERSRDLSGLTGTEISTHGYLVLWLLGLEWGRMWYRGPGRRKLLKSWWPGSRWRAKGTRVP